MSGSFSLLKLYNPSWDTHPRSWFCLAGPHSAELFGVMEKNALGERGMSREQLSRHLAVRFQCSSGVFKRVFQGHSRFYPYPIILALHEMSRQNKKLLGQICDDAQLVKVNSASAKPIRVVKKLTPALAKILGAFMADGSLSVQVILATNQRARAQELEGMLRKHSIPHSRGYSKIRKQHYCAIQVKREALEQISKLLPKVKALRGIAIQSHYSIELADEYKDNVEAFARWMMEVFGTTPNRFEKRRGAWRVIFSNKAIARYFMCFFDVWPGPKTEDAFEPSTIKRASLRIRKEFAKGVLMFDGSVTKGSRIMLNLNSLSLLQSIQDIWEKDHIRSGKTIFQRKSSLTGKTLSSTSIFTTADNHYSKLSRYFEKDTQKWKLLRWLSGQTKARPYLHNTPRNLSVDKVLDAMRTLKVCDVEFLQRYFDCSSETVRTYLKILERQNLLRVSRRPRIVGSFIGEETGLLLARHRHALLFRQAKKFFIHDKNTATFLGVKKSTYSAWRNRKNRVPIRYIKELCDALGLNVWEMTKAPSSSDRAIAEIKQPSRQGQKTLRPPIS